MRPEFLSLGEEAADWPQSVSNCKSQGLDLISLSTDSFQQRVTEIFLSEEENVGPGRQAWIGLRRSSMTGEWYWLSQAALGVSHWENQGPGSLEDPETWGDLDFLGGPG